MICGPGIPEDWNPGEPNHDHDAGERKVLNGLLNKAIDSLRGHFSSCIIIATHVTETGATARLARRDGDWYAQTGAMRYILKKREQEAKLDAKNEAPESDL